MAAALAWAARRSCSGISRCRRTPPATVELVARLDGRGDTLKVVPYATIPWQNAGATYTGPGLAVQWIEVEGPLEAVVWPPATRAHLLGDVDLEKGTLADAASVLRRFAPRAFRRPVSDADLAPYLQLVSERLEKGVKFADALRVELKAVLVSPRFLKFNDAAVISAIVRRVKAKDYGFRTLIHEITASTTFQTK